MEHCEHCKKTGDHLKPCRKEECPMQAFLDGQKAAKKAFGNFGKKLRQSDKEPRSCRPATEQTTLELISLFGEIAGRLAMYGTETMHNRFWEIRRELERRAALVPPTEPTREKIEELARWLDEYISTRDRGMAQWENAVEYLAKQFGRLPISATEPMNDEWVKVWADLGRAFWWIEKLCAVISATPAETFKDWPSSPYKLLETVESFRNEPRYFPGSSAAMAASDKSAKP